MCRGSAAHLRNFFQDKNIVGTCRHFGRPLVWGRHRGRLHKSSCGPSSPPWSQRWRASLGWMGLDQFGWLNRCGSGAPVSWALGEGSWGRRWAGRGGFWRGRPEPRGHSSYNLSEPIRLLRGERRWGFICIGYNIMLHGCILCNLHCKWCLNVIVTWWNPAQLLLHFTKADILKKRCEAALKWAWELAEETGGAGGAAREWSRGRKVWRGVRGGGLEGGQGWGDRYGGGGDGNRCYDSGLNRILEFNWFIASVITFGKYSQCVTLIFSFDAQTLLADEIPCFCGRLLGIDFLIHRSGYWLHLIERMNHFVGNFLLLTLGQVQSLPILLVGPEVKIWKKTGWMGSRNARDTYEGAAADVDVDPALVAEAEEAHEEECKEDEQRRKSDSRYQMLGVTVWNIYWQKILLFGHVFLKSMESLCSAAYGPDELLGAIVIQQKNPLLQRSNFSEQSERFTAKFIATQSFKARMLS